MHRDRVRRALAEPLAQIDQSFEGCWSKCCSCFGILAEAGVVTDPLLILILHGIVQQHVRFIAHLACMTYQNRGHDKVTGHRAVILLVDGHVSDGDV